MKHTNHILVCLLMLLFFGAGQLFAEQNKFVETYDMEVKPCEGLYLNGMSYSFTVAGVPSLDCNTGSGGPGNTNNITYPNIEGTSAGVLHLRFDVPTTKFGFGIAQSTFNSPQEQSVIVDLFRPGVGILREEIALDASHDPAWVGARYDYSGPAIRTVTIRHNGFFDRFAIDNVSYFRPPGRSK